MPNQEKFTDVDEFLEWYKSKRPETIYLVKNKARYTEVMDAIRTICDFAIESNPEGTLLTMPTGDPLLGTSMIVEITSNLVVFEDMKKFCSALSKADNFEIRTTSNNKAFIGIVFADVYEIASAK